MSELRVAVAAGKSHSLILDANGHVTVKAGTPGDLGAPDVEYVAVSAGWSHSLALRRDGSIVAWGQNECHQCNVAGARGGYVSIAAGTCISLAVSVDGRLEAWGADQNGMYPPAEPNVRFVAVAVGQRHCLALKSDGSIVGWGNRGHSRCTVPAPNSGFSAVAAGEYHSLGLREDGAIVAWGRNQHGQCDVPTPKPQFVAISAGDNHNLGLRSDGSIVAWGANNHGQCDVPAPNADFAAVAAGAEYSIGVKLDGSIVAWGSDRAHQCTGPQRMLNGARYVESTSSNTGFVRGARPASGGRPTLVFVGGLLATVGFFLPWLQFGSSQFRVAVSGDEIAKTLDSYWIVFWAGLTAMSLAGMYAAKALRDVRLAVAACGLVPLLFLVIKITRALTGAGIEGLAVGSSGMTLGLGVFLSAGGLLMVALGASRLRSYGAVGSSADGDKSVEPISGVVESGNSEAKAVVGARYCGHCGKAASAAIAFCTGCGQKLE